MAEEEKETQIVKIRKVKVMTRKGGTRHGKNS